MELKEEVTPGRIGVLDRDSEMAEMIRNHNWSGSPLGPIEQWPISLKTTLGVILHSAFPQFLFWGEELICFYNDAFRPSLGSDGKHPCIGKKGKEVWPEIWEFIGPLIHQVMSTGKAVEFQDQLVPFYRNGKIEDIYWTFCYSPAFGDDGQISGCYVTCTETTTKVQTIKKLVESEKRFQVLVREANVGIVVLTGEEMRVSIVNDAYGKLLNRTADELKDKPLFDIIPEGADEFKPLLENVRLTGEPLLLHDHPYSVEQKGKKITGFLNVIYQPYREDDGSISGVMALCQDVTAQVQAKKNALESEQRLRSVVESAPFPIGVYTGREMRIRLANKSIMDVWGKGYDVIGKLYSEILPELSNQQIFEQLDQVYTQGVPFHARNQRVDLVNDGQLTVFYFNYSFTPLFDADGVVYGVMNTAADVTDLNIAKQKVEQSEKNIRNMILQAPVAMCILLGPDHVINVANRQMIEIWGKTEEAVLNKPVFEALPDVREQGLEKVMQDVYNSGVGFHANEMPVNLLRHGTDELVYVNFVYEPYRDSDNNVVGILAIAHEVTQQVLARQKIEDVVADRTKELAAANSRLQMSNEQLAQFAYIASHDLQEPVRKVSIFTQLLESNLGDTDERSKHYIGKIKNSSARMLALIRDVLAYSQLSNKTDVLVPVDLNSIINDIENDLELLVQQKHATIQHDVLPKVNAIPLQMSQLFGNLISNALKFTRPGVKPAITISVSDASAAELEKHELRDGAYHHISVSDNGIGFSQENAEKIFNIFQRLNGKKQFEGTGIGLAVCRKIAQNHAGAIYATSVEETGTTFHVLLPKQ
jgi:PAS domain S-box-containing protein